MSEYFLADRKAEERARQKEPQKADGIKVTLLGDFMFPTAESQGFDPYNSTQGKAARDAWLARRRR